MAVNRLAMDEAAPHRGAVDADLRTTGPTRIAAVTLMGVVIAVMAAGIFDHLLPVLALSPLAVGITALASRRLRRTWRAVALVLAAAASALATAVVEDGGPLDVAEAVLRGPRRLLTTEWPSPVEPSIVVAVGLLVAIATAVAALLADVPRWRFAPVLPLAVAAVIVIALGAPEAPAWWTIALLGLGTLAVGTLPPGELLAPRTATLLGDRTIAVTTAGIAIVAVVVSAIVPSTGRADPRSVEEADITSSVLDPIEATVALRRAVPPIELFEITDRSAIAGRALPTRWRLSALGVYDGQRWVPQVTLRPIGERLGLAPPVEPGDPPPITYEVVYRSDDLDLVPFPGRPLSVDAPVETDLERVAVRLTDRPVPGTTVTATSMVAPSIATVGAVDGTLFARRPVDEIAQTFAEQARELGGDGDLLQQLRTIETTMRSEWVLDRDTSGGGQQLALLDRFVTETRRGTREQFVTAYVLFARSLGVDARVATGFVIPPESLTSPLVVESGHAASWPEIRLDDAGGRTGAETDAGGRWLAFDPVPVDQETIEDDEPTPPDAQSPAAVQPPIQPPDDEPEDDEERTVEVTTDEGRWGTIATWAARIGIGVSIGLLPVLIVIGAILTAKWWRRRTRLRHPDPAHRVRGAWANVADELVDAGLTIGPAWTDDRIARGGAPLAPSVPHELRRLAAMATAMTFGARGDAGRLADDAMSTSRAIDAALRAERTRWQRIRWRLSLRSFRPRSRSPVVA
ncbi:MAG TPA: transglutaminase-like domain-containing protein [Ilumatobacter sp.]|nr:transglutaminase-like domain-containing protein [Ilumatobacter sp.]